MFFRFFTFVFLVIFATKCFSNTHSAYHFPNQTFSIGFYDNTILPNNLPYLPHPLFWKSKEKVDNGMTFIYESNVFHTQKYFAINFGTGFSYWEMESQVQLVLSAFFEFRIWFFRTKMFNPYFVYSIAGPTLLSLRQFGNSNLGERFIFQDYIGLGAIAGSLHAVDISIKIYHYSNGDFFLHNDGFDVPFVLTIGYVFNAI